MRTDSFESALKRAHSSFRIIRQNHRAEFPAMIFWYDNEICACPRDYIPERTIKTQTGIVARGLKEIMDILKGKSYLGYDYKRLEKMVRKVC